MDNTIECIGEIDFRDTKVKVYLDHIQEDKDNYYGCWAAKNLDKSFSGLVTLKLDGSIEYSEDYKKHSWSNTEILPKFIIVGYNCLDDLVIVDKILKALESEYKIKNNINNN